MTLLCSAFAPRYDPECKAEIDYHSFLKGLMDSDFGVGAKTGLKVGAHPYTNPRLKLQTLTCMGLQAGFSALISGGGKPGGKMGRRKRKPEEAAKAKAELMKYASSIFEAKSLRRRLTPSIRA